MPWSVCGSNNMCHRKKKRIEKKEDKGDVGSRAGNSFFFYFISEKKNTERGKAFLFWSLDICIC